MTTRRSDTVNLDHHFSYYLKYSKKKLRTDMLRKGTLNSGLIFLPKDYRDIWFDIYRKVASPESGIITGQGVWNTLFWLEAGNLVSEQYNFTYQGHKNKRASILHFVREKKLEMDSYKY